jgi:hypothetical protein
MARRQPPDRGGKAVQLECRVTVHSGMLSHNRTWFHWFHRGFRRVKPFCFCLSTRYQRYHRFHRFLDGLEAKT